MHESATRLAGEVVDDLVKFLETSRGTTCAWAKARVYQTIIRRNIKLAESCSFGQTVFDYAPRSHGAVDYARLAAELLGEMPLTDRVDTVPAEVAYEPKSLLTPSTDVAVLDASRHSAIAAAP